MVSCFKEILRRSSFQFAPFFHKILEQKKNIPRNVRRERRPTGSVCSQCSIRCYTRWHAQRTYPRGQGQCSREKPMENCLMGMRFHPSTRASQSMTRIGCCATTLVAPGTEGCIPVVGAQVVDQDLPDMVWRATRCQGCTR